MPRGACVTPFCCRKAGVPRQLQPKNVAPGGENQRPHSLFSALLGNRAPVSRAESLKKHPPAAEPLSGFRRRGANRPHKPPAICAMPHFKQDFPLLRLNRGVSWTVLSSLTALAILVLETLHVPASGLLGAIMASVLVAIQGTGLYVPQPFFVGSQGIIGCMIAASFTLPLLRGMLENWFMALLSVVMVIIFGFSLGWFMTIRQILPGNTAIWGTSPGAATPMVIMSEFYGADPRLVAFMQYMRVVIVVIVAALIGRFLGLEGPLEEPPFFLETLFPPISLQLFAATLFITAVCTGIGQKLPLPAGAMLLPMLVGSALQLSGLLTITLPPWLLYISYIFIGWSIGLRFTRPIFMVAVRALPVILLAILILVALCGSFGLVLSWVAGIDPLTAYLATSPGGMEATAIIAASSGADMAFVMAIQTARLIIVILTGPPLARFATGLIERRRKKHGLPPASPR